MSKGQAKPGKGGADRAWDYSSGDGRGPEGLASHLPTGFLFWPRGGLGLWVPRLRGQALLCPQLLAQAPLLLLSHEQLQLEGALAAFSLLGHLV